jgi:hypothetical protein
MGCEHSIMRQGLLQCLMPAGAATLKMGCRPGLRPVFFRSGEVCREVVTWIPDVLLRSEAHGDYRIVAAMPDRDGDHVYRIKSPLDEYERVVKEDLLVKSKGYLPEEVLKQRPRRRSITLPRLTASVGA